MGAEGAVTSDPSGASIDGAIGVEEMISSSSVFARLQARRRQPGLPCRGRAYLTGYGPPFAKKLLDWAAMKGVTERELRLQIREAIDKIWGAIDLPEHSVTVQ